MLAIDFAGVAHAQSVTCRDGTVLSGASARQMCAAHGGMAPGAPGGPWGHDGQPGPRPSADATEEVPQQAQRPHTPRPREPSQRTQAPGGGPGQVWVNAASKAYHCPGTQCYGRTKRGEYMAEAAAKACGDHPADGHACP